ncbi:MAG: hypothetical protein ACO3YY_06490 [Phycisphaerales bacterium]
MRRRGHGAPVSFFSFQDVMVCTIGLTLLLTLVLILQVGTSIADASASTETPEPDALRTEELSEIELEVSRLEARLAELEARAGEDPIAELARTRRRLIALDAELALARREIETADAALVETLRDRELDAEDAIAAALARRRDRLAEDLDEMRRRQRIVYLVSDESPHPPTVAEISSDRVVLSFDQESEASVALSDMTPERAASNLLELFTAREDWRERTLLVVLKPSGLATWSALLRLLREDDRYRDVAVGVDLLAEDRWTSDRFPAARPKPIEEASP